MVGFNEHGIEASDFIKRRDISRLAEGLEASVAWS
jgi:hypothetical protein